MLAAYATALGVVAASALAGAAVCAAVGAPRGSGLSPAVGFAVLLLVARVTIELPGGAATAAGAAAALALVAPVVLRGARPSRSSALTGALVVIAGLVAASLPFLASGRYGTLGVSVNNDPAFHAGWIEELRTGLTSTVPMPDGYPVAPHALAAAAARLTGDSLGSLGGLLMAAPLLTALTALGPLASLSLARRAGGALLVALPYLGASYYAEASYKEPMVALLLLGVALVLRERSRDRLGPAATLGLLALLSGAAVATFSWIGLAWPLAAVVAWAVAEAVARRRRPPPPSRRAAAIGVAALAGLSGLVLLDPGGSSVVDLGRPDRPGGNLVAALSPFEALGVWFEPDFRFAPDGVLGRRLMELLALAALAYGTAWWLRRRDLAVPATVLGAGAIYVGAAWVASPYTSAKALAIMAPVTMLLIVRPLLEPRGRAADAPGEGPPGTHAPGEGPPGTHAPAWRRAAWTYAPALLAVAFLSAAAWSSGLALRGAQVGDDAHARSLERLRPRIGSSPVLFLGKDDYVVHRLRGTRLSTALSSGAPSVPAQARRAEKPDTVGAPFDFDSLRPDALDRFRFVVTTATAYASAPPPNWRRAAGDRHYTLWERRGPTPPSRVLAEGVAPGATLRCDGASRRTAGRAVVRPTPVLADPGGWIRPSGLAAPAHAPDTLRPGQTVTNSLRLTPGRWEVSLQYLGPTALRLRAPGLARTLPPNLELPGPWWPAGVLRTRGGRVPVSVTAGDVPWLSVRRTVAIGAMAATRVDEGPRTVALAAACGRYVDRFSAR